MVWRMIYYWPGQVIIKTGDYESFYFGLRTIAYKVGNLQEAKEWYTEAFEMEPYFDESFYVGFSIRGYELGLMPEENPASEKGETVVPYRGVDDIKETYERLPGLGATANEEPQNVGGDIMVVTVMDLWRNRIGIIYNPEFKLEEE